ncbi:OmpA family protein [Nocardiopsis halotolerans]|uniref:OmpA family protein n=1 Tax=Nocardiopsis halotolerans TaxID=124252 RepID=UPI000A022F20|nr:OmpA family protein [Nocardiopsis halotolerans]
MKKSTITSGAALTSLAVLLTSGCVVNSNTPSTPGEEGQSLSTPSTPPSENPEQPNAIASSVTTSTNLGSKLQIDIYALERLENDLLRLRLGITNSSSDSYRLYRGLGQEGDKYTASAVSLIDSENQQRYLSFNLSNGKCFCLSLGGALGSGETGEIWVMYPAPPEQVTSMTIVTPLAPPMLDIPITDSPEEVDIPGLAEPEILDLTMISDGLEDNTGRTENNEEVSIILSSDVLFETNSADLSPEAQEILEQVATEIDSATSSVVNIDGHADNTGSDSINILLSQDRAEAVESALSELITRRDISFEVEGHGSRNPIANNETEEGRERNRRVSVTFEKQ